jgi:hypothetical protein
MQTHGIGGAQGRVGTNQSSLGSCFFKVTAKTVLDSRLLIALIGRFVEGMSAVECGAPRGAGGRVRWSLRPRVQRAFHGMDLSSGAQQVTSSLAQGGLEPEFANIDVRQSHDAAFRAELLAQAPNPGCTPVEFLDP